MRDPLSWIPVRYKLPLTFAFLCLVAFGLGGYVVTTSARESLSSQIQLRLNDHATALNLLVDKSLEHLGRRVEDFASDGFIRLQLEQLVTGEQPQTVAREALVRHLRVNKLPLVEEFVDIVLLDVGGQAVLGVHGDGGSRSTSRPRRGLSVGLLSGPSRDYPYPTFRVTTDLHSIHGERHLGFLQAVVRADVWARKLNETLAFPGATGFSARLGRPGDYTLSLIPETNETDQSPVTGTGGNRDRIRFTSTVARTGWQLDLAVDRGVLTIPVNDLVWKFLYVGAVLVALTIFLVLFPRQFLLKPLSALQEAAHRIAEGDFSARVESSSKDEVGDLANGFNFMASAIEERTRKLQQTAEVLERREGDIRFERDRLNAVIRSMEDGLFILDANGRVTLSNAAARPVIKSLSENGDGSTRLRCRNRDTGTLDCMQCISDFDNEVQGCVVTVGSRVYEINGAVLPGPLEAIGGKVFVSRDVTERVRQSEKEAHHERLSVLGEIAAVMAHELNNPLAAISMFSQMLMKGLDTGSGLRSHAEVIYRNTESCKATIRGLLDMATTSTSDADEFDVRQLVVDVRQLLEPMAQRQGVSVTLGRQAQDPMAFGDELQLRQATVNLVMNGVQALEANGGGGVSIATEDRGDAIAILVRDDGPGIPAEIREHIFEPFFTTKAPGEGTGLGLPTSRRIVDAQGGKLTLMETGPDGTVFEMVIPRRHTPGRIPAPVTGNQEAAS